MKMTIPRLELMSALIAIRAIHSAAKEHGLNDNQLMLWADSKCVLDQRDNKNVFVRNRVNEIIKKNDINLCINTKHNPADIPTKGMTTEELKTSDLGGMVQNG